MFFCGGGGLLSVVRRSLSSSLLSHIADEPAQFQVLQVAHWIFINGYVPPREELVQPAMEKLHHIFMQEQVGAGGRPWLFAGDANLDADSQLTENISVHGGQLVDGVRDSSSEQFRDRLPVHESAQQCG